MEEQLDIIDEKLNRLIRKYVQQITDVKLDKIMREYLSKIKCCDECFCEFYCIENQLKKSRIPERDCDYKINKYLTDLFDGD
mgnify:CR=1 FL=1